MSKPSVLYLAINLPRSGERRQSILAQAEKFGIDLQIVDAVDGKDIVVQEMDCYDLNTRRRYFYTDLTSNEVACVLSHRKALKLFLDSGADYVVIVEDDAELAPHFNEGVRELTEHLRGWQVAKLFTADGRLFPLMPHNPEAPVQPVFPKKILWMSIGYMYTREGAQALYEGMQSFYQPADVLIAQYVLKHNIPTIGVEPGMVLVHPVGEQSDIDSQGAECRASDGPVRKWFAHRCMVWRTALGKRRMRRNMSRLLHRD